MSVAAGPRIAFERTYAEELGELVVPWRAAEWPAPRLLTLNEGLAAELGLDPAALRTPEGVAFLVGAGAEDAVAMAYAGHQFGFFQPRLGDGRALLLGEVVDVHGRRRDVHLKGSGRTPFARGGDGKAAVGPMLREHLVAEAMHALEVPTTRALAVVATGEDVLRETRLPGAVLARVAASHLRVGTFQYAASALGPEVVKRLADYAIARHHPDAAEADEPYLALLQRVVDVQAALVARWMLAGFVHGVMNTDNVTISGETIDYGPCAFMDRYDPATVFSSIDHGGRYAYGNQPALMQWDLARLAEALLPLIPGGVEAATEVVLGFTARFDAELQRGMARKLGVAEVDVQLVRDLLELLERERVDWTSFFRGLARGEAPPELDAWVERWRALGPDTAAMDRVNPVYVPRNHLVEEALAAATAGDLAPFEQLLDLVTHPYEARPGLERFAEPSPAEDLITTYCGT